MSLTQTQITHRLHQLRNQTRLHAAARQRVLLLKEENTDLKKRLEASERMREELQRKLAEAEATIRHQGDVNKKLRAMLFKTQRQRTKRTHEPIPRTAESYRRPKPDHVTEKRDLILESCPDCGTDVTTAVSSRTRLIEDIVFNPLTEVIEWTINRYWCIQCEKQVEGTLPGILPKTTIGSNTLTFVVISKYRWNQPYAKIQDQLDICFGMSISEGEIARLIQTAATLVGSKWQEIIQAVKAGQKVHCDETGWYIDGQKVWAHTFTSDYAVLYEILPSRGKAVAEKMLAGYVGTRITDCLPNYKNLSGSHQVCWVHLTREAQENAGRMPEDKERKQLKETLDLIYADLRSATRQWHKEAAAQTKRCNEKRVAKLVKHQWQDERCQILVNRLRDFHAALFTCLDYPGIPPDNNQAERVLRKLVIQRKISGGNRSGAHAVYHAKLMSVLETLRLEGGSLLPKLQAVLQQGISAQLAGQ